MEQEQENFCGACIAAPLALLGSGMTYAGVKKPGTKLETRNKTQRYKKLLIIIGIITIVTSIYFYMRKCNGDTCSL